MSLLYKIGLKFKDSSLEGSYVALQNENSQKLFSISCAIFSGFILVSSCLEFNNENKIHIISKVSLAVASFFILCLEEKMSLLHKMFFSVAPLCFLLYYIYFFKQFFDAPSDYGFFLAGNMAGLFEVLLILGCRRMLVKVSIVFLLAGYKFAMVHNEMIPENIILIIGISCLLLLFFVFKDLLYRQNFEKTYTHHNNLTRVQDFLTKELHLSVLIISSDMKNCVFSNNFFELTFGKLDQTKSNFISLFMRNFVIDSLPKVSSSSTAHELITLEDFLFHMPEDLINETDSQIFTLLTTSMSNTNIMHHYEIKLSKILWNNKFCYSLTFEEVTDKYLAKALQLANEQKERVIATLSHELRTPINGIIGLIEISLSLVKDKVVQEYLQLCKSCTNLLLHLVNSTIDLNQARQNTLQINKSYISTADMLKEIKSLFAFQSQQKGLRFEVEKAADVPTRIYTDKKRLLEVLVNLLSNAFKFTFRGSVKLTVSASEDVTDMLTFTIIDTGIGIKEEEKSRLFAMFEKINDSKMNSNGAGLGLTIANTLVKALNHSDKTTEIEIHSESNRGSAFSFNLCIKNPNLSSSLIVENHTEGCKEMTEEAEMQEIGFEEHSVENRIKRFCSDIVPSHHIATTIRSTSAGEVTPRSPLRRTNPNTKLSRFATYNKHVLVVDDNPFNLVTASFILEKHGLKVTCAKSGEECLEMLETSMKDSKYYDLILMDIQMPVLSGIETSQIIKRKIQENKLYNVLIIALTANPRTKKALMDYRENGMLDALDKPLKDEDIYYILSTYFYC